MRKRRGGEEGEEREKENNKMKCSMTFQVVRDMVHYYLPAIMKVVYVSIHTCSRTWRFPPCCGLQHCLSNVIVHIIIVG